MSGPTDADRSVREAISRRQFVGMGAVAVGGAALAIPFANRAFAASSKTSAVIQVFLHGGPSQLDTWDPKPGAPAEFRGPFSAIRTAVPGVQVSETFPRLAALMDKVTVVRSVANGLEKSGTAQHLMFSGFRPTKEPTTQNEHPAIGSVAAALRGARKVGVPAYANIPRVLPFAGAAFLSAAGEPYEVSDPGPKFAALRSVRPPVALDTERRAALSKHKIALPGANQPAPGADQALQSATNPAVVAALNVEQESAKTRARYGSTLIGDNLLLARRMVQAGVTFVTVEDPGWAMHSGLEQQMSVKAPALDQAISALVEDLSQRGLYNDVLVVVQGEFGRTARMNKFQGRGNSGTVYSVLLAGGGLKMGRVVGRSDARGEFPADTPLGQGDVLATIYAVLGIDPLGKVPDASGQPTRLLNNGTPIKDLV